jgi:uncharacterized membrane protein (UPF0182 family)
LSVLFGGGAPVRAAAVAGTAPDSAAAAGPATGLLQQAQQHYDRAIAAQRAGDWATYGREIDQLGVVLRQLRAKPK